jgi:heme/copper-type cytochrome/quinol oxidase subunit 3
MSQPSDIRIVGDLSGLPGSAMGARSLVWWGTLGFMLIEGTGFVLAAGAYLYLRGQAQAWPPYDDRPPDLAMGTLFTVLLLLSEIPNRWVAAKAKAGDAKAVRWGMVLMSLLGLLLVAIRALEFGRLNVRWDQDAYGSAVWLLMFLHATHLITDLGDTIVLGACLFTHKITDSQFADVNDNAGYWTFVVLSWLPIYALVYWGARLL